MSEAPQIDEIIRYFMHFSHFMGHDGKRNKPAIHTVSDEQANNRLAQAVAVIEEVKGGHKRTRPSTGLYV